MSTFVRQYREKRGRERKRAREREREGGASL